MSESIREEREVAVPMFYIRNMERAQRRESIVWWRQNGEGYTCDLDDAGRYTAEEARGLCRTMEDVAYECASVERLARRYALVATESAPHLDRLLTEKERAAVAALAASKPEAPSKQGAEP